MTIAVISAKGGVGKTTLTSNVAAVIAKDFGKRVLAIDGNITTPTLGIHLGILSQEKTLDDVLHNKIRMQQAIYIHPCGLHIIPSSLAPNVEYPDTTLLKEKIAEVKDSYDIIFIDAAAGIGREVLSAMRASDDILVVTNPDMASIVSAIKAIKIARSLDLSVIGIVVNRVTGGRHEPKLADIEELCETRVVGTVPYDKAVLESVKKMTPIVISNENSPASRAFRSIAAYLVGETVPTYQESLLQKIIGAIKGAIPFNG
jgi:septum site-determining protein MinD